VVVFVADVINPMNSVLGLLLRCRVHWRWDSIKVARLT